jgi:hypothetical protein
LAVAPVIRREQTEKNATNDFKKSNYLNVFGFKHLVDIEGVTGSIPVATIQPPQTTLSRVDAK